MPTSPAINSASMGLPLQVPRPLNGAGLMGLPEVSRRLGIDFESVLALVHGGRGQVMQNYLIWVWDISVERGVNEWRFWPEEVIAFRNDEVRAQVQSLLTHTVINRVIGTSREWLTRHEIALILNCSDPTVWRLSQKGEIPYVVTHGMKIRRPALEQFLTRRLFQP